MKYHQEEITNEINGIKAFAILGIIINHFNQSILPSGFLGVDIFFFISGYSITSFLSKEEHKSFLDFLTFSIEKGLKRILPSLFFFVLVVSILISMFHIRASGSIKTGFASLLGLSNFAFYLKDIPNHNFADFAVLNPFMHTWALGVLSQFYLLYPFLLWFTGFARKTNKGAKNLIFFISLFGMGSIIGYVFLYFNDESASYFLLPSRFWEMASGCLLFISPQAGKLLSKKLESFSPVYVSLLIFIVMLMPESLSLITRVIIIFLSALLILSIKKEKLFIGLLKSKNIVYLGELSYSLYLWHWSILSISIWTTGIYWWSIPFQLATTFVISVLTYSYIERPFIEKTFFKKRELNIVLSVLAIGVGSFSILQLITVPTKTSMRSLGSKIFPSKYANNSGFDNPLIKLYCHLPSNLDQSFKDCFSQGNIDTELTNIYLTGDSHASNHFWSIKTALKESNVKAKIHILSEYGIIKALKGEDSCGAKKICIKDAWLKYLTFFTDNLNENDFVFISLARDGITQNQSFGLPRSIDLQKVSYLKSRLRTLAGIINENGAKLVLIDDIPKVCKSGTNFILDILVKGSIEKCTVSEKISLKDREGLTDSFLQITNEFKNVFYIDPHSELCNQGICSILDSNKKILYSDNFSHFREDSKEYLTGFWREYFNRNPIKLIK